MSAPRLSIVTTCKGRLDSLKRALPTFVGQGESEVIVVDYDCPDRTKDWVGSNFPAVRVAVVTDAPIFNLSRARNIGAGLARAPWLVFCDADNLLSPSFASEVLARVVPGTYLRTLRNTPFGPVPQGMPLVCETVTFRAVGGFDDAIRGWGAEDREMYDRLDRTGVAGVLGAATLMETLPHDNAARSSFYEHEIEVSVVINRHYAKIKQRYFETRGRWFDDEQRHSTYRQVEQAVLAALAEPASSATFEVRIEAAVPPWTARLTAPALRDFQKARIEAYSRLTL